MGFRLQRASVNPTAPEALGTCDRCGFIYQHNQLKWQYEWTGNALTNLRLLVCYRCLDEPNPQFKALSLPPDPVPIENPRPNQWALYELSYVQDENSENILDENGQPIYSDP